MLSGWSTFGILACPYCMDESDAFTLQNGRKETWFDNHRKFLPLDHPFRRNKYSFRKNRTVTDPPPKIRSGVELLREIDALGLKKVTEIGENDANVHVSKLTGWKKKSIFWDFPYWSTNLIRHNLDVMLLTIDQNTYTNTYDVITKGLLSNPWKLRHKTC